MKGNLFIFVFRRQTHTTHTTTTTIKKGYKNATNFISIFLLLLFSSTFLQHFNNATTATKTIYFLQIYVCCKNVLQKYTKL